jgi:ribosomal-protein-alanine N-acetyltransferase
MPDDLMLSDSDKSCRIRLVTSADLAAIMEIEERSFESDAFPEATFVRLHRSFPDFFIVAEIDSHIGGYMITGYFGHKGHIISIAVDPCCRERGVGNALVQFTLKKLKDRGVKEVYLDVRVTNEKGLAFWEHLGFSPIRTIHRYYEDGEDALRMRKTLTR